MNASTRKATKKDLRQEIAQLRIVGCQMANLCFNLSQSTEISERHRKTMGELYRQWDAIKRTEP